MKLKLENIFLVRYLVSNLVSGFLASQIIIIGTTEAGSYLAKKIAQITDSENDKTNYLGK
jgi:hypothetical protein